eukprot:849948-Rhodomonas_salina.1
MSALWVTAEARDASCFVSCLSCFMPKSTGSENDVQLISDKALLPQTPNQPWQRRHGFVGGKLCVLSQPMEQ